MNIIKAPKRWLSFSLTSTVERSPPHEGTQSPYSWVETHDQMKQTDSMRQCKSREII